jgi:hypothetical protein
LGVDPGIARGERRDRGEIAAGAVAADGEARRVEAEAAALARGEFDGGDAILDRGGKAVLGRQAVVEREHDAGRFLRQLPADRVVRLDIADAPAAAMKIKQCRQRARARRPWPVEPGA